MIYAKSKGILFVECPENGSVPKSYQEFGILISRGNLGINFWEYAIINKCEQYIWVSRQPGHYELPLTKNKNFKSGKIQLFLVL